MTVDLRHLEDWVSEGLIRADQADAIRRAEQARATQGGRVPLVTEALGYLGAALAFAAGAVALTQYWDDMAYGVHVGIAVLATLVTFAAGWLVRGTQEPAFRRFSSVLWVMSVAGFGWIVALVMTEGMNIETNVAMATGIGVLVYGAVLYALMHEPLQQVAIFIGAVMAATDFAATDLAATQRPGTREGLWVGLALWTVGALWMILGFRLVVRPRRLAYCLGAAVMLQGAQAVSLQPSSAGHGGLLLGLVTAIALLAASVWLHENVFLLFGAIGLFGFLLGTIAHFFGETLGTPLVLLTAGLVMLGVALLTMRLRRFAGSGRGPAPASHPS